MFDTQQLNLFPTAPGVYLMKDKEGVILYIGKAKNIRQRVRQYFLPRGDGRPIIPYLVSQIATIDTLIVQSEKEALIVENNLIKKHQPKYNALLKDDKTYCSLMINYKHQWPMIKIVRFKGRPPKNAYYFGPFTQARAARQTLGLLRHLFPMRQCSDHELESRTRPCILYDLKQCIAPCVNKCTHEEYDELVKRAINFLRGHDSAILKDLQNERDTAIEALNFEKAERIHTTIRAIESTLEKQRVEKAGNEDMDAIGLYREGDTALITALFFREGKLIGRSDHLFTMTAEEDEELLSSFLFQQYAERQFNPPTLLLPLHLEEESALAELLNMSLVCPQKGDKKALVDMALENAKIKFAQEKDSKHLQEKILMEMEETFRLTNYPERIECFDISTLAGKDSVGAMVVFTDGEKDSRHYRKYKLKETEPGDDYGALREVLKRRYGKAKEEGTLPDCLLIDGGKGHLSTAHKILEELDITTIDLISIAKEDSKHTKGMTAERVFLLSREEPIAFSPHSSLLFFLQRVRDEAHRFAITFQKVRRKKKLFQSALDDIPGIGPIKKKRLLKHFGSLKRLLEATPEEWLAVEGINKNDVEALSRFKKAAKE